jgi:hypothetical protein
VGEHEGVGEVDEAQSGVVGHADQRLDGVELALVGSAAVVEVVGHAVGPRRRRRRRAAPVFAREPPAVERRPHQHADVVLLADGQHVPFHAPSEHRVRRLLGHRPLAVPPLGHPLGLDQGRRRERRRADGADLALVYEVGQSAEGLVDVNSGIRPVHLVQVDPVGAQAAQTLLDGGHDPPPRVAPPVRVGAHRVVELGGQHDVVTVALQGQAEPALGHAVVVDVGGVEDVHAGVEGVAHHSLRLLVRGVAPRAEHHRAEAERAHRDARAAEGAVLHQSSSVPCDEPTRWRRVG